MLNASEILTAVGAGASVVAVSIAATLYLSDARSNVLNGTDTDSAVTVEGRRGFDLSDAFFPCRDHIPSVIPYKVRNVNVDSLSSRYDEIDNSHVVFIDLEVMDRPGTFYSQYSREAHVVCRVSAANNEITSFKVRKG